MTDPPSTSTSEHQQQCQEVLRALETKVRALKTSVFGAAPPLTIPIGDLLLDLRQRKTIHPLLCQSLQELDDACRSYLRGESLTSYQSNLLFVDAPQLFDLIDAYNAAHNTPKHDVGAEILPL